MTAIQPSSVGLGSKKATLRTVERDERGRDKKTAPRMERSSIDM